MSLTRPLKLPRAPKRPSEGLQGTPQAAQSDDDDDDDDDDEDDDDGDVTVMFVMMVMSFGFVALSGSRSSAKGSRCADLSVGHRRTKPYRGGWSNVSHDSLIFVGNRLLVYAKRS